MKRNYFLLITLLAALILCAGCGGGEDGPGSLNTDPSAPSATGGIHIDINFELNIDVEEGKAADGFTWENNFNEITITGYIGASDTLTVPNTINGKPVTVIKDGALNDFTGLKSIVIPGSVRKIAGAFQRCTGLQSVVIAPQGLESMSGAFKDCTALKTINIPSTVTTMDYAFENCSALDCEMVIPEGVTSLRNTFSCCTSLKKVVLPQSVTDLQGTFNVCHSLVEVNIPSGVTELKNTFQECKSLQTVQLPDGVTNLTNTFTGCTALQTIHIPDGVLYLNNTFSRCTSLKSIVIPEGVSSMDSTFRGCTALESVELPDSLVSMDNTFAHCTALKQITIPAKVRDMNQAFLNCTALQDVEFAADYYEMVSYNAFYGCTGLKRLELPVGVHFTGFGCISLEELIVHIGENTGWVDEEEPNVRYVNLTDTVYLQYLPAIKNVQIVSDVEGEEVHVNMESTYKVENSVFTGPASWYDSLVAEARRAKENGHGYRYYNETMDDGTQCRQIIGIYDSGAWNAEAIPVEDVESRAVVGHEEIYTLYSPALIGDDLTPGVILYKSVTSMFVICSRPESEDDVKGTDAYADCEYSETVNINGVDYPIYETYPE